MKTYSIAVHGGAGTIVRKHMTPELEKAYHSGLEEAVAAGFEILANKGSAMDAVCAAVVKLEDNVLFNAGRGSVFTKNGTHEMDAAIMNGKTLEAGAVAGVQNVRNPITLAAEVLYHSPHVFLSGAGANHFALERGISMAPDEYFFSRFRYKQWIAVRDSDAYTLDHSGKTEELLQDKPFGTVGAVACDAEGNIAAATSTGGMTNKQYGRVGDTPVIGSGTYANNRTCAISCTGHGEPFLRAVAAFDVSALMEYRGLSLKAAMEHVVNEKLVAIGGEGGMIGVDVQGNVAMLFNSAGMYRAMRSSDGSMAVAIYK